MPVALQCRLPEPSLCLPCQLAPPFLQVMPAWVQLDSAEAVRAAAKEAGECRTAAALQFAAAAGCTASTRALWVLVGTAAKEAGECCTSAALQPALAVTCHSWCTLAVCLNGNLRPVSEARTSLASPAADALVVAVLKEAKGRPFDALVEVADALRNGELAIWSPRSRAWFGVEGLRAARLSAACVEVAEALRNGEWTSAPGHFHLVAQRRRHRRQRRWLRASREMAVLLPQCRSLLHTPSTGATTQPPQLSLLPCRHRLRGCDRPQAAAGVCQRLQGALARHVQGWRGGAPAVSTWKIDSSTAAAELPSALGHVTTWPVCQHQQPAPCAATRQV